MQRQRDVENSQPYTATSNRVHACCIVMGTHPYTVIPRWNLKPYYIDIPVSFLKSQFL